MIKLSKLTLFLLILINSTLSGIFFATVNWSGLLDGVISIREIQLPILFFLLSIYFVFPYVKIIKSDKKTKLGEKKE